MHRARGLLQRRLKPRAIGAKGAAATLAVAAPGFAIDAERLAAGESRLAAHGFAAQRRPDLAAPLPRSGAADIGLAGSDASRAAELQHWLADPGVDAILCARGGYGCQRILPLLRPRDFRRARKPLVGFSDVTALLLWQFRRAKLVGFHGPMFDAAAGPDDAELERLAQALRGEPLAPLAGHGAAAGVAEGPLLGGSLTMIAASLGTDFEIRARGAILLFEEIGERPYAIDRMMQQLRAAGVLQRAAGFGVGHLVGCGDVKRPHASAEEVLRENLGELGKPLVLGLPFGHRSPNMVWPLGVRGRLDSAAGTLEVLEAGVQR